MPDIRAALKAAREGSKPDVPYTLDDMAADAAGLARCARHRQRAYRGLLDGRDDRAARGAQSSGEGAFADLDLLDHQRSVAAAVLAGGTAASLTSRPAVERSRDRGRAFAERPPHLCLDRWPFDEERLERRCGRELRPRVLSRRHHRANGPRSWQARRARSG